MFEAVRTLRVLQRNLKAWRQLLIIRQAVKRMSRLKTVAKVFCYLKVRYMKLKHQRQGDQIYCRKVKAGVFQVLLEIYKRGQVRRSLA